MKNLILSLLFVPTLIFSDYLQDGLYPDCSYVIVDEDGWKIHKNQDGKVISMTPKSKHNEKMGKYSFDKFGNLVPYRDCVKQTVSTQQESSNKKIEIDLELNLLNLIPDFKIYGGLSMPIGSAADMYESGFNFGSSIVLYKFLSGEINMTSLTGKDDISDLIAMSATAHLNRKFSEKLNFSIGGGLSRLDNGAGMSLVTKATLSYDLPLNLGMSANYSKFVDVSKNDGSIEFDYELLDSFNLNLYFSF